MFRTLFALLFFIAGYSTAQAADQKPLSQADAVVAQLSASDVVALVKELGGEDVDSKVMENVPVITFKSGGTPYAVILGCSSATVCEKITTICYFAGDYPLEYLNKFNQDIDLITVVREKKGVYSIRSSINMSGGVTRGNIANSLATFVASAPQVPTYLNSQVVAGLSGADPALRAKETIWQAMVLQPSVEDAVARANRSHGTSGALVPGR